MYTTFAFGCSETNFCNWVECEVCAPFLGVRLLPFPTDRSPEPIFCLDIPCSLFTLLNFCVLILSPTLHLMDFLIPTVRQNFSDGPANPESDWTCA